MSAVAGNVPRIPSAELPSLVLSLGDAAVGAYREFLHDASLTSNTRRVYANHARRFCRCAETCGLTLPLIMPSDIAAYLKQLSHGAAGDALSSLRCFFAALIAAGVLTKNPCGRRGRPWAGKDPAFWSPDRFAWELQSLRRELMAELEERDADDPTFNLNLIRSIDRKLASMAPKADAPSGGTQESADAQ